MSQISRFVVAEMLNDVEILTLILEHKGFNWGKECVIRLRQTSDGTIIECEKCNKTILTWEEKK